MAADNGGARSLTNRRPDSGGRSTVYGTRGAVACEDSRAAMAGIRALDSGGTAADACVAMAAVQAVVSPMMTGMGGDAFLLFYDAGTGRVLGANGSGRAPGSATLEKFRERGFTRMPERGGETVTVPGAVHLWEEAADKLGYLSLRELLSPARDLAADGFAVGEVVSRYWEAAEDLLRQNAAASTVFMPGGRAPRAGQLVRNEDLAATLDAVIKGGSEAFYNGDIARRMARSVREMGGYLSEEDLASHKTLWVEPISTDYRGVRVYEIPPPGQGIAALQMLNILEGFDLGRYAPDSAGRVHLEAEAKKLAFKDLHEKIGDPESASVPTAELLSKAYAARLRKSISSSRASNISAGGVEATLGGDTTYLCAVDAAGNGCSFINSLYMGFGSGVVAPGTGVCLQNRGNSFQLAEGHPNALAPGKRPMHTIIPGLATSAATGRLWATFGVMGGPMQPQGHTRLLANLIDYGMNPQEAVDHPRHFHNEDTLLIEARMSEKEVARLRDLGHRVSAGAAYEIPTGGAQLIRVLENGVKACGSDPRKDGCALVQ